MSPSAHPNATAGTVAAPPDGPGGLVAFTPFFKAFGNDTRVAIIEYLMSGEKCVCEITARLSMSQPLISHHLAILRDAGFVRSRGAGARTYYAVDWKRFDERLQSFVEIALRLRDCDAGPSCVCG
jgi:DNA-binding transcriptional ArsR family regulator